MIIHQNTTAIGSVTGSCERRFKANGTRRVLRNVALAAAFAVPTGSLLAAGPLPVNLGSTANFAILAGAAITTTGGGLVYGDVGASPIAGSAIAVSQAQVHGTIYEVDASGPAGAVVAPSLLTTAKGDMTIAFNDAANRTPVPSGTFLNPGVGNIGGMNLIPGLYKFTATASITGTPLTLTGGPNDVWIFQIAADLQVASYEQVILAGGAQARNVFWQVGTSANIGTYAVFAGTIIAYQGVVMMTGSSTDGRLMSFNAGVTFDGVVNDLPQPAVPVFTSISVTNAHSVAIVLSTTPYFPVTLQSCTNLAAPNWQTVATNYPSLSPWVYTDTNAMTTNLVKFYQAFITTPD
jgi:hypothetical protein